MEKLLETLNLLKALKAYYHSCHLSVKSYSMHLLFDRLGKQLTDNIDRLSEAMVSEGIEEACLLVISYGAQLNLLNDILEPSKCDVKTMLEQALKMESVLGNMIDELNTKLGDQGLINVLAGVADVSTNARYLIKRSMEA